MVRTTGYPSMFVNNSDGKSACIRGSYVDQTVLAGKLVGSSYPNEIYKIIIQNAIIHGHNFDWYTVIEMYD